MSESHVWASSPVTSIEDLLSLGGVPVRRRPIGNFNLLIESASPVDAGSTFNSFPSVLSVCRINRPALITSASPM